uniref:OSJNBb0003B01.15 protein n=1 Tax=Oryza sativa subsp. japonica TaxID=39947 RepID=Q7XPG8_ORYSJ|nr:OSJNBb0003B01.15 [Oryza sativa Japonica Group]
MEAAGSTRTASEEGAAAAMEAAGSTRTASEEDSGASARVTALTNDPDTDELTVKWLHENMEPLRGGDQARYRLNQFADLKKTLSDTATKTIDRLGFGSFLGINMEMLPDKQFAIWTASLCKPAKVQNKDVVVLDLDPKHPLVISQEALHILTGLPMGQEDVPENLPASTTTVKEALSAASGKSNNFVLADAIKASENARDNNDHMLQVKLFIGVVFNFAIFTTTSLYFTAESMTAVSEINKLVKTNWCEKLIAHMNKCLKTFHSGQKVSSPVSFVLFFLENINFTATTEENDIETPRLNHYTEEKVISMIDAIKKGVKLKDWKDTVFGQQEILEVQANDIEYIENYKQSVKKRRGNEDQDQGPWKKISKGHLKKTTSKDQGLLKKGIATKKRKVEDQGPLKKTIRSNKESNDEINIRADVGRSMFSTELKTKIKINILDHEVSERNYVECFKQQGYMNTSIMFIQCALWNQEWKGQAMDKVILSQKAMYELLDPEHGTSTLADELGQQANLCKIIVHRTDKIFIPVLHEKHWFLIVISRKKDTIYILDSLPCKSREAVICGILETLQKLGKESIAGSQYICEVLDVQRQGNNYDCGFHVLLYIKEFDDTQAVQICEINKDMVEKIRIETAVDLVNHKLNKRDEEEKISYDDDDDVELVDEKFSYSNFVLSSFLHRDRDDAGLDDAGFDGGEIFGGSSSPVVDPSENQQERAASREDSKADMNENQQERAASSPGAASRENSQAGASAVYSTPKLDGSGNSGVDPLQKNTDNQNKRPASGEAPKADMKRTAKPDKLYCRRQPKEKAEEEPVSSAVQEEPKEKPEELVSSAVQPSSTQRPRRTADPFGHYKPTRQLLKGEILELVHQLAIGCKEQVILEFEEISMTGSRLEQSLQGGADARDLIILLMKVLDKYPYNQRKRIFLSPVEKDGQDLEKMIVDALPVLRSGSRTTTLKETTIYCPVLFQGEWIVACCVFSSSNQVHVFCHKDTLASVKPFCIDLGAKANSALKRCGYNQVKFPDRKVAYTGTNIKVNDSAFASMYFIENFGTSGEIHFNRFLEKNDEVKDEFIKDVKLGLLPYLLNHKNNTGTVPNEISELIKKNKRT